MTDSHLIEKRIASEEVMRGRFLHVLRDSVELPDGATTSREYVVHPGAVLIVPLLIDASGAIELVLERQFRYPLGKVMIEFPAGKLDPAEDSLCCAQRELREETGYSARQWAHAGVSHSCISYSTEFIDIWFARGLTPGQRQLDAGEFLDVFCATPTELIRWCNEGRVTDGKTLSAAFWLQNVLSGAWHLNWQDASGPGT